MVARHTDRGYTLTEVVVTVAVMSAIAAAGAPLGGAWVSTTRVRDGQGVMAQATAKAKSLALRNPVGVTGSLASAVLCVSNGTVSVRTATAAATQASCSDTATAAWSASLPSGAALTVGSSSMSSLSCLAYSNRGVYVAGANTCSVPAVTATTWKLNVASGGQSADLVLY